LILEQIVIDNEIGHMCRRLHQGVDSQESRDLYADIEQVGPGGHFLKSVNTRLAARSSEFYMSDLLDRHTYAAWLDLGRPGMYSRARERVREILAGPVVDPLPERLSARLDGILHAADRELARDT
jgi:trimethylamine:corrinoid methyltransferase-like protein